jgi:TetR/AcrR family transcriptional regulator
MPSIDPERSTPKLPTEQRQASLVQAAVRLAAERSPAEVTTADLAQAVGITQGAVFRHFPSKEAVWLAVLDWTADSLLGELQAAAEAAPHPLAALQAVFKAHVDFVIRHPGVPRLIFQELQHAGETPLKARVRGLMQRYRALVIGLLEQAREQGQLLQQADLEAATVLFIGSVQGLVMQALVSGQVAGMALLAPRVFRHFLYGFAREQTPFTPGQAPVDMESAPA